MNKKIIAGTIGIAAILIGLIASPAIAQFLQSISNQNTGTVSNPQTTINIFYAGINKTDGTDVDWGTLLTGQNTLPLNVTNISTAPVRVRLYITDLDPSITLTWLGNGTMLDIAGQPLSSVAYNLILTIPDTIDDGTVLTWNQTVAAEPI